MDTGLVHPFTSIVAGPTGCGKTTFIVSLLRHSHTLVNLPPEKITWCYGEWQPLYSTLSTIHPNLECVEGLPDMSSFDSKNRNLVVIVDLMPETDERVTKLFTKKSHRCNRSIIYLVQHLVPKGKESRNITINAQYMDLFKNPRDNTQVVNLAKHVYPGGVTYIQEAFRETTSVPQGYLFVDLKQSTPEHLRLRSNIITDSGSYQYAYIPKISIETRRSHIHHSGWTVLIIAFILRENTMLQIGLHICIKAEHNTYIYRSSSKAVSTICLTLCSKQLELSKIYLE